MSSSNLNVTSEDWNLYLPFLLFSVVKKTPNTRGDLILLKLLIKEIVRFYVTFS